VINKRVGQLLHRIYFLTSPSYSTAGVLEDGRLAKQTPGSFRRVAAGKVAGVQALEQQLSAAPTRGVIAFSSVSSVVAPLGQPNYASANASLCAWASAKAAQGTLHLSLPGPESNPPQTSLAVTRSES
jgi:KR domain